MKVDAHRALNTGDATDYVLTPERGRGLIWGLGFLVSGRSQVAFKDGKTTGFFDVILATLLGVCVNRFWTTRFSTWLGEVSVSRLVAESKVNASQKTLYIFGFFLYTFVVLCAVARFINSCCVQCPKCRCWNNKIIFQSRHRQVFQKST